jgi:hypothetical protein
MNENGSPANAGPFVAGSAPSPPTDILVEHWWADHFPGSPVAQLTPAWNHAFAAKEELKRRLAHLVGGVC